MVYKVSFVILTFIVISTMIEASVTNFKKTWPSYWVGFNLFMNDWEIGKDNVFPYALCKRIARNERHCTVINEHFNVQGVTFNNKCHSEFKTQYGSEAVNVLKMRSSKNGKILISYVDQQDPDENKLNSYLVYRIIDTTTCQYHEGKIRFNETFAGMQKIQELGQVVWYPNVVQYVNGSFDVFIVQPSVCDTARCKHSFNSKGETVGKAVSYLPKEFSSNKVIMHPTKSKDNYFAVVTNYEFSGFGHSKDTSFEVRVLFAKPEGKVDELVYLSDQKRFFDVDGKYEYLGICWTVGFRSSKNITVVECRQYDSEKKEIVNVSIKFPFVINTLSIRNLPSAGLVLLIDECENNNCEKLYLKKIGPYENYGDNMEIDGFTCTEETVYRRFISISHADDQNICVSIVCKEFQWEFQRRCYQANDLQSTY